MKIAYLTGGMLLLGSGIMAQEPADALRYSWLTQGGTARNYAIGGTMVSLGGDLSATYVNPAGLAFYKTNEFVLTPGFSFINNKSTYLGETEKGKKSNFNYGASGLVFATPTRQGSNWRNYSFGLAVNRAANFNSKIFYKGLNNQTSYSEKYLEELINNNVTDPNAAAQNFPYGASLAFNTYLIDTISGTGGSVAGYRSLSTPLTGVNQQQEIETKGGITDFSFGASANLLDKLYLGGSIGINILDFERTSTFREEDATTTVNNFNYFTAEETLKTSGMGINAKLGIIYRPVEYFRVGLAFHTPTFYNMKDEYTAAVTTDLEGYGGSPAVKTQSSKDFNSGEPGEFNYNLVSPLRLMLGASYVFREENDVRRQRAFLSADVEYVDYKASSFKTADQTTGGGNGSDYFEQLNTAIDNQFKSAFNARIGGELKFHTFMVRAGFAYYGNPYQDDNIKGRRMNLSGGLGYRDRGVFIDLTYVHQLAKDGFYPYRLDQGFFAPATVKGGNGNLLLTFGFKF
jgi:hypothetical protein